MINNQMATMKMVLQSINYLLKFWLKNNSKYQYEQLKVGLNSLILYKKLYKIKFMNLKPKLMKIRKVFHILLPPLVINQILDNLIPTKKKSTWNMLKFLFVMILKPISKDYWPSKLDGMIYNLSRLLFMNLSRIIKHLSGN